MLAWEPSLGRVVALGGGTGGAGGGVRWVGGLRRGDCPHARREAYVERYSLLCSYVFAALLKAGHPSSPLIRIVSGASGASPCKCTTW